MAIGLPNIEINFKNMAISAVNRSSRGIVALLIEDDTDTTYALKEYKTVTDIEPTKFTAANVAYIKQVMAGGPSKVLVAPVSPMASTPLTDAIEVIGNKKYNYIGWAEGSSTQQADLVTYVKAQEAQKKTIKAVVYNTTAPDSMHVINFTNDSVTYADSGETVTGEKYIPRLLGIFAGLPLTQSSTYMVLDDLASVAEPADVEAAVNAGELVLFNDDEQVRIARGVNSLVTYTTNVTESMSKIAVVEAMDLIRDDIYTTFKDSYLRKYKNKYDNQVLLLTAINAYFNTLANEEVLDNENENVAYIDVEAQRKAWLSIGKTEAAEWDDATVRIKAFRDTVFLAANIKILDAMENFVFNITMK
ncbi:Phage tail sheath protein [compost metagenome]